MDKERSFASKYFIFLNILFQFKNLSQSAFSLWVSLILSVHTGKRSLQ